MTETIPPKMTIFEALGAVMDRVRAVGKDSTNTSQNYKFRGIDAVVNAVGPALRENGVIVVPEVLEAAYRDVTTSNGKPSREVTVKVRYRFWGPTGDYIDAVTCGESMDFGDKGTPKAMSVAFRVALLQALCLPTDEPDADHQSYEREDPRTAEREAARAEAMTKKANELRDEALDPSKTVEQLQETYRKAAKAGIYTVTVVNENGDDETLKDLIKRIGEERKRAVAA